MNSIDILIVLGLCAGIVVGFFQGVVRTAAAVAILYGMTVLAAFTYPSLAPLLVRVFPTASLQLREASAFLFILLVCFNMVALSIRPSVRNMRLGESRLAGAVDKLGGVVVGFFLAGLWIGLALILMRFILSLSWLRMEVLRYDLYVAVQSSSLAAMFHTYLVPMAVASVKPWFAPFGGLPRLFIIR